MKFSELLGEPEPDPQSEHSGTDAEPIGVFAPEPVDPPPVGAPPGTDSFVTAPDPSPSSVSRWADNVVRPAPDGRSGLAELNVRPPLADAATSEVSSVSDQLLGLTEIDDDLLPSARRRGK